MIDKLKEAQEELRAAADGMQSLNTEVEARDGVFTDDEQNKWDAFKEKRSSLAARIGRLKEMEDLKKDQIKEDNEVRKFDKPSEDKPEARAKVVKDKAEGKEARNHFTGSLLNAVVVQDEDGIRAAQKALNDGGHYADLEMRDGYSTFKDSKGGIFIPTTISTEIFDMEQQFGIIPRFANNFGINGERKKIPSIIGRPTFTAINERSAISGSGTSFGGILLDLLKWGTIVDWTNEVGDAAGNIIIPILQRKVAEASAFLKDDAAFNADGTSAYHNLKGFINLGADSNVNYVRETVAATGNTTFATLDAADYLAVQYDVSPSVRSRGIYVMHPDMLQNLLNLKDDQGQFVYKGPNSNATVPTLWGRPLEFSEAFPIDDGVSKPALAYFDPQFFAYGTGATMNVTRLTEATIVDEDSNSINLATMDAQALRFIQHFDFQASNLTTTTNGVAKGAFAVLKTAAS